MGVSPPSNISQAFHAIWAGTGQPPFHSMKGAEVHSGIVTLKDNFDFWVISFAWF